MTNMNYRKYRIVYFLAKIIDNLDEEEKYLLFNHLEVKEKKDPHE